MNLLLPINTAWRALGANKNRSFLTMLGIIIGIAAVITIFSVGKGAESLIQNQITSVGSNLIGILPGASDDDGPPASVMGITITTLKNKDIDQVEKKISEVVVASGYVQGRGSASWQNQKMDINFIGVESDYLEVEDAEVEFGRFFLNDEDRGLARVVVIGSAVNEELFLGMSALGQKIKIKKESFTVIGVMKERGVVGFSNQDRQVIIPLKTAQKIMLGIDYLSLARVRVEDGANMTAVGEQIKQVLRDQHNISDPSNDDFSVRNSAQALDLLGNLTGALSFFLAAIGAISLLVGGIGIMNIMLVSVNERVNEIGLRKAIGARAKDIEAQFLIESIMLTVLGALIGIMAGVLVAGGIALAAKSLDYAWDFKIGLNSVLISCGIAALIGITFGYYPARQAAKLNPIDALRYE